MATYLIVDSDSAVAEVEAKNIKEAATKFFNDEEHDRDSIQIYRVAAAARRVTLSVETVTKVSIE